jgi:hypothetical protein
MVTKNGWGESCDRVAFFAKALVRDAITDVQKYLRPRPQDEERLTILKSAQLATYYFSRFIRIETERYESRDIVTNVTVRFS